MWTDSHLFLTSRLLKDLFMNWDAETQHYVVPLCKVVIIYLRCNAIFISFFLLFVCLVFIDAAMCIYLSGCDWLLENFRLFLFFLSAVLYCFHLSLPCNHCDYCNCKDITWIDVFSFCLEYLKKKKLEIHKSEFCGHSLLFYFGPSHTGFSLQFI